MELRIRPTTTDDAHALKDLDTIVPIEPQRAQAIDRWLQNNSVLVAEINGRVVGYGVFDHGFFGQSNVAMLMLHRDYRGQRIGEHILRKLEEFSDTPKLWVTTNQSNHRMQGLLSRLGYRPCGYIHELDPEDPELVFVKDSRLDSDAMNLCIYVEAYVRHLKGINAFQMVSGNNEVRVVTAPKKSEDASAIVASKTMAERVLVILPAFNEEQNLPPVLQSVRTTVPECDVLVVNDGSTDRTAEVARSCGAIVLDIANNLGVGAAVQTGFRYAWKHGYDRVVRMDSDGQHPPEAIPGLLAESSRTGCDLLIASRFGADGGYRSTRFRSIGIHCLATFLSLICRKRVADPTSGFQVLNRPLLCFFAHVYPVDYPEPEALAILRRHGYDFAETPVAFRERASGRSSIRGWGTFYYIVKVFVALLIDRMKPMNPRFARHQVMEDTRR